MPEPLEIGVPVQIVLAAHLGTNAEGGKMQRRQKADPNVVKSKPRHPAKIKTAESIHRWACFCCSSSHFRFGSILLTYCQMAQCLITHIETIMC